MKVLSFGAVVWDIIEDTPYIGGAPFNVAAHLARCGARSYMLTSLGDDEFGRRSRTEMARLGVEPKYVQTDAEHPTSTVIVQLSESGQPTYVITEDVSYDHIRVDNELLDVMEREGFAAFSFGTIEQRGETTRKSLYRILDRLKNLHVLYDVNLRLHYYTPDILKQSLEYATILKLNDEEAGTLSNLLYEKSFSEREFAQVVRDDYQLSVVLITRGEKGTMVYHDGACFECPGVPTRVVDAVGPGDAFSAAFLFEFCRGKSAIEAADTANRLGAYVASQHGAIPDYSVEIVRMFKEP